MRLAWFSPWPPQASGIAGRSAELVPALAAGGHGIDVYVDEQLVPVDRSTGAEGPTPGQVRVASAHDFVWRMARRQYDLAVYQVGNSRLHEFIWPYLFRWPGLAVLHDARLHHARGRALLSRGHAAAYRAEFAWSHPDVSPDAAELAVAGFDGAYYYLWPMARGVVATSRMVAVHARGGAALLQNEYPDRPITYLALGEGRAEPASSDERHATRAALGLVPESVAFGLFGGLTADKRVSTVLRAFRATRAHKPAARLVLGGAPGPATDWPGLAASLGVADAVTFTGPLDDEAFDRAIAAVDVTLNLRWPTAVETSGPWLRAMAAGRPTVVFELAHQAHLPAVDPRSWQPWQPDDPADLVTVALDVLDEDHSLRAAMRRLATDPPLRASLGRAARAHWEREHSPARMLAEYVTLLDRAASTPVPQLPGFVSRPIDSTRPLLEPFGELQCTLF